MTNECQSAVTIQSNYILTFALKFLHVCVHLLVKKSFKKNLYSDLYFSLCFGQHCCKRQLLSVKTTSFLQWTLQKNPSIFLCVLSYFFNVVK